MKIKKFSSFRYFALLGLVSFPLHFVWENTQGPLYSGYESFWQWIPYSSYGVTGDVFITFLVLLFFTLIKQNENWVYKINNRDIFALAILGFLIAVLIELNALYNHRWGYNDLMPLLPPFKVGLSPAIQMTILLPLSFYLTKKILKNNQ